MKVFLLGFLVIFLKNDITAESYRNGRQFNHPFHTTRAPLINRVRERLTSLLMQNHEHLAYHHQQYHQHHHNHWNVLHGHFYTLPMTPVAESTTIGITLNTSKFKKFLFKFK